MNLSVVIVSWNTRELLRDCLESLQVSTSLGEFEVVVVDNASSDGSQQMVRENFPEVRLIENVNNLGFARANNQAIPYCQGKYILLLNSDTIVPSGALRAMVDFFDSHPGAGAGGPKLLNPDGSFQASYAKFPSVFSELLLITGLSRFVIGKYAPSPDPIPGEKPKAVDWVAGAALFVRKATIDQVGLLNENYFFYSEETEWCWRFWNKGWEVWYLPHVEIVHLGGGSSRLRTLESYNNLYASKIRFFSDVYGYQTARWYQVLLIATTAVRVMVWSILSLLFIPFRWGGQVKARLKRDLVLTKLQFGKFVRREI